MGIGDKRFGVKCYVHGLIKYFPPFYFNLIKLLPKTTTSILMLEFPLEEAGQGVQRSTQNCISQYWWSGLVSLLLFRYSLLEEKFQSKKNIKKLEYTEEVHIRIGVYNLGLEFSTHCPINENGSV